MGERVAALTLDGIPDRTRHWAKTSILDTIGVAFAGRGEPGVRMVERLVDRTAKDGPCLVFGGRRRLSAPDAAMINGVSAHVLDFDTSNDTFEGHPSVQLMPALFAVAEEVDATGAEFLLAYIAGFEVQALLAKAAQPALVRKGWFPTSSLGVFGAAAGACRLMRLSAEETARAISASAMLACGTLAHAGSMMKPFGSGHAARNGVLAALLVKDGFTAAPDAVEDHRGFLATFADVKDINTEKVVAGWGAPYDVDETSIGIKRYPCCGIIHSSLDVLSAMMRDEGVNAGDVEAIDIALITQRLHHIDRPNPKTAIEGKFSIQYCAAHMLQHGSVGMRTFTPEALADPRTRTIMARIHAGVHPDVKPTARRQEGGTEITLTMTDGRKLSRRADKALGRVPGEPLPDAMVGQKFLDCTSMILKEASGRRALDMLWSLEGLASIRDLGKVLSA
jgi:2-methylcitrate dehydratase PrpD